MTAPWAVGYCHWQQLHSKGFNSVFPQRMIIIGSLRRHSFHFGWGASVNFVLCLLQVELPKWRCTCSSWVWTGTGSWGRKLNLYLNLKLKRTPVTLTVRVSIHKYTYYGLLRHKFVSLLTHRRTYTVTHLGLQHSRTHFNESRLSEFLCFLWWRSRDLI